MEYFNGYLNAIALGIDTLFDAETSERAKELLTSMGDDINSAISRDISMKKENADLKAKVAELEEYNQQLQSMKMWSDKAESKVKADAIREIGDLVHEGNIKVRVSETPYACDWVDADEWLDECADKIERG